MSVPITLINEMHVGGNLTKMPYVAFAQAVLKNDAVEVCTSEWKRAWTLKPGC